MRKHDWRLDLIKIIAIIMVLYNHLYCYSFIFSYAMSEIGIIHYLLLIPSVLCKCGPPLFFMVSGVVLLGKNETYKKILSHRVSRILIVMIGISVLSGIGEKSFSVIVSTFLGGLNWYLYAYLAFLLMLPIYRRIVQNFSDNDWIWFILIVAFLNGLQALMLEGNITFVTFSNMPMLVTEWASVSWHIIFPILGYGLYNKRELVKKKILNIGMVLSVFLGMMGILIDIKIRGGANFELMHQFFIVLPACAIFYFIICIKEKNTVSIQLLSCIAPKLAPLTFGMFLIDTHSGMRDKIYGLFFKEVIVGLHGVLAAWWIIIVLLVVYGIIVGCMRLIPIVKKVL